jgi:hypothetical protein
MVTNTPEKISDFGVIHTGISDHSLIFAIRKISVIKKQENIVEMRNMKNFKVTGQLQGYRTALSEQNIKMAAEIDS